MNSVAELSNQMRRECACLNLRKAVRVLTQAYDEKLRPAGVRSTQLPLLVTLAAEGTMTLSQLAEAVVMDQTTLSRNLKPLKERGLIEIRPGQDRRVREISLTRAGENVIRDSKPLWDQAQAKVSAELGIENVHTLIALSADIVSAANST